MSLGLAHVFDIFRAHPWLGVTVPTVLGLMILWQAWRADRERPRDDEGNPVD